MSVWPLRTPLFAIFFVPYAAFAQPQPQPQPVHDIGVLIGSYGDIDAVDEVRDFIKNTLNDRDVVPLDAWVRAAIAELGYRIRNRSIIEEYREIGGRTNFRKTTSDQAHAVAALMSKDGFETKGYAGFTMTFPFVKEALSAAQADGVKRLIVFYQGAQYSRPTAYVLFRHVEEYLSSHPEWNVQVVAVKSFSDDLRFQNLLVENIEVTWNQFFPNVKTEDVCLFLPIHGNITVWEERGDPYREQIMRVVRFIQNRFPNSYVAHGFQNHDEIPFIKWTKPSWTDTLDDVASRSCPNVVASGQISYTVDSLETLFDHAIEAPRRLRNAAENTGVEKNFALVPMFNNQPEFAELLRDIAIEALNDKGDIVHLGADELEQ